jgi:putative transposase
MPVMMYLLSDFNKVSVAYYVKHWRSSRLGAGTKTIYINPGSHWVYGYCESFNGKLRDELLKDEIFDTLRKVRVLIEQWRITTTRSDGMARYIAGHLRQKPCCRRQNCPGN